jgi:hypothetical protein
MVYPESYDMIGFGEVFYASLISGASCWPLISKLELLLVNVCHNPLSSDFISLVLPD